MRKTKIEDESKKSFDSFFESELPKDNISLSFPNNSDLSSFESNGDSTHQINPFFNLIKQILLFPLGAILLYAVGFISTIISMDILSKPWNSLPPFQADSASIFGIPSGYLQITILSIIGFLGIFMTWFGLGDVKNKKHFSIPVSIFSVGVVFAITIKIIETFFSGEFIEEFDKYFIYLLPLVFVVPVIMKTWFDNKPE